MVGRRVHVNWLSCRLAAPNRQFSCGSDRDHTAASLNIVQATEVNIKHELTPAQARRCLCVRKDGGEGVLTSSCPQSSRLVRPLPHCEARCAPTTGAIMRGGSHPFASDRLDPQPKWASKWAPFTVPSVVADGGGPHRARHWAIRPPPSLRFPDLSFASLPPCPRREERASKPVRRSATVPLASNNDARVSRDRLAMA
ncbi:hypothetical protein SAMN05428950_103407 [Sphingomonas sp. OV641]|nr:hypothetical protein SAMN05428950_103407 [Sphingomonas sp. OV641]